MRTIYVPMVAMTLLAGCVSDHGTVVSNSLWTERLKPKSPDVAPDTVELHYIFIERELGNESLEKDVWSEADELLVSLDQRKDLEANGLRIGKVGSQPSQELLKLLEDANPTGQGRKHVTLSGGLVKVQMTENMSGLNLLLMTGGQIKGEDFEDVQGFFQLTPTISEAGGVHISLIPVVEYGPKQHRRIPAPDLSGFQIRSVRDSKVFTELGVELEVAAGEYILLGRSASGSSTLGDHYFVTEREQKKYESVLLIRVIRPHRDALYTAGCDYDDFFLTPIKSRSAGRSTIRETVIASRNAPPATPLRDVSKGL